MAQISRMRKSFRLAKRSWPYYLMLLAPIVYYFLFRYVPIIGNVIAFRKYSPGGPTYGIDWVGLRYFSYFLYDAYFWKVFFNTFRLSALSLVIGYPVPILFALLLNEITNLRFKKIVQNVSYLPHFLSTVVVVGLINEVFSSSRGIVNELRVALGYPRVDFLLSPGYFLGIYVGSGIWQNMGWNAILYIATLTNIDPQLYEASEIDGAGRFQQALHITLPGLMNTIVITLIMAIGGLISVGFEKVLLLYNTMTYDVADVISTYVYRIGMVQAQYSYSTAIGLFESIIGITLISAANRFARAFSESSLW